RQQRLDLTGGALGDVEELLLARRQEQARGGSEAVAHDGEPGAGDQDDEQRRDVGPEREAAAPGACREGGRAVDPTRPRRLGGGAGPPPRGGRPARGWSRGAGGGRTTAAGRW